MFAQVKKRTLRFTIFSNAESVFTQWTAYA